MTTTDDTTSTGVQLRVWCERHPDTELVEDGADLLAPYKRNVWHLDADGLFCAGCEEEAHEHEDDDSWTPGARRWEVTVLHLCGACGQHHGPALTDCDHFSPEEWAVISDAVMHVLGVLPDDGQGCFACFVADETDPHSVCPDHGAQRVVGHYSTRGADPYDVEKLACGCDVICMGPGEPMTVVHVDEPRARRWGQPVVCHNELPTAAEETPDAAKVQAYTEAIEHAVDGRW